MKREAGSLPCLTTLLSLQSNKSQHVALLVSAHTLRWWTSKYVVGSSVRQVFEGIRDTPSLLSNFTCQIWQLWPFNAGTKALPISVCKRKKKSIVFRKCHFWTNHHEPGLTWHEMSHYQILCWHLQRLEPPVAIDNFLVDSLPHKPISNTYLPFTYFTLATMPYCRFLKH